MTILCGANLTASAECTKTHSGHICSRLSGENGIGTNSLLQNVSGILDSLLASPCEERCVLTLPSSRRWTACDGTTRRDFLQAGALLPAMCGLPGLLRARSDSANPPRNSSVIWLFLSGGPTQLETFDPKPENSSEFRSVVGSVQTNVPGTHFGGLFRNLSRHADKLAIVRSFAHTQADHPAAAHYVMTGRDYPPAGNGAPPVNPGVGSILSRHRGPTNRETGLPTYVSTEHLYADGPAWLGKAYSPFPARGEAVRNMAPRLTPDKLTDRRALRDSLDTLNRQIDKSGVLEGMDNFDGQAMEVLRGAAPVAFDLSRESPRTRDRYGPGLGQNLLLARRLCEAGVGYVTVWYGGWDSHGTNPAVGHGTIEEEMHKLAPSFDRAVPALLEDIHDRGLQDDVLVVITGEFGRTPWLDPKSGGRDHWPHLGTLALAGGGLKTGQIVGQSSAKGDVPKSAPIHPQDLMATMFCVLGVPQDLSFKDSSGRHVPMLDVGKPINELF